MSTDKFFLNYANNLGMKINERLRLLRTNLGLGQAQIAALTEVSIPTVSEWEKGKITPNLTKLIKLSDFYGVSLDYIVKGTEKYEIKTEERLLVNLYRQANDTMKFSVMNILKETIKRDK